MPALDEQDLRHGLRALTAGQPPAPDDRPVRSAARARSIRRRRAAAGVAAAVALAAPVAVLATGVGRPAPDRAARTLAAWPDRSEPGSASLAASAEAAWRTRPEGARREGERIRRLYAGTLPGARGTEVVVFAACVETCDKVVLAHTDPDDVTGRTERDTPWILRTGTVPPETDLGFTPVGWTFPARNTVDGPSTMLFVLADPRVRSVTWGAGVETGELPRHGAAFAGDIGHHDSRPYVTLGLDRDTVVFRGLFGVPGLAEVPVAWMRRPAEADPHPLGWRSTHSGNGQLFSRADSGSMHVGETELEWAVFLRCAGAVPLRVAAGAGGRTVPCDGATHRVPARAARDGWIAVELSADSEYVTYRYALASRPRSG